MITFATPLEAAEASMREEVALGDAFLIPTRKHGLIEHYVREVTSFGTTPGWVRVIMQRRFSNDLIVECVQNVNDLPEWKDW